MELQIFQNVLLCFDFYFLEIGIYIFHFLGSHLQTLMIIPGFFALRSVDLVVTMSPTRLGVRAFQSCQGVSL